MTRYGSIDDDRTVPIVLGIVIVLLIGIGILFALNKEPTTATIKSEEPAKIEPLKEETLPPIKEETVIKTEEKQKEDCTFYRTMYYANFGKPMSNYYFIQWQGCEGRNT